MICVWRKVRNGDRTALRAIPVCAPQPFCVGSTVRTSLFSYLKTLRKYFDIFTLGYIGN